MRRVVVTGLGAVCPIGNDVKTVWENAIKGVSGVGTVTRFDASDFGCRIAAEVKDFDVTPYMSVKEARHFDRFIHFGIAAAFQAIDYLAGRGHRKIGVLGGNWSSSQISYRRLQGCQRAFEQWGLSFDLERQTEPSRYSMADAYEAAKRLLERCPELTAIFAMSDVMAIGVIRALRDLGKRVPEDISVMGYDGISIARYSVPRLTTICQDTRQLAEQGVKVLLDSIEEEGRPVHKVVPFRMLDGESVAQCVNKVERGRSK